MTDSNSDVPPASPPDTGPTPGQRQQTALTFLDKRPPLPPAPMDDNWTWTADRLKAVYLDAFTDLNKVEISDACGMSARGFYKWRQHADYKRYLAELVFSDGLADKVERTKTRKDMASKLLIKIMKRLDAKGDMLAEEKLPTLIKAFEELMSGITSDAAEFERKTAGAVLIGDTEPQRVGLNLVNKINEIKDPDERATVKKHLLSVFREYIGDERTTPAATPNAIETTAEPAETDETPESSTLDNETAAADETTSPPPPPAESLDAFEMSPPPEPYRN